MRIGIIGSTGVNIALLTNDYSFKSITVEGKECKYYWGKCGKHEIILLARNLYNGAVPPHLVQYKLLMKVFKELEVNVVVATSVVGSLNFDYKPGDYVVLDQFIDMTKNTPHTAFEKEAFAFVDFTYPYCEKIRKSLLDACKNIKVPYHEKGCYVGVDGPRYETAAEVRAYRILGGDVVGMTNVTEAIMAREMGLCYGSVAVISNYGAGMADEAILRQDCYNKTMEVLDNTIGVIKEFIEIIEDYDECICRTKIDDMIYTNL